MSWLIIKNDLIRNKVINLALLLFMTLSAGLAVLSVIMAVQTFSSISELYKSAQPPHFLQMHKGEYNQEEVKQFMDAFDGITYGQTSIMIDVYGDWLSVVGAEEEYTLSDCRLDIGLVKQNQTRDLLLDSKHEMVTLQKGEIGIPVLLKEMYDIEIGDHIILSHQEITEEFIVKEFVLDAMMNSTMCSSTRILISDEDFQRLVNKVGEKEYLIEAYFESSKDASDFQTAYQTEGLPQNGQAITYTMMYLLSAITDIATVFVLLLVSVLLIMVSFICIKFTIMAAMEEDISEIGTMKAIGLPFTDIRDLYLYKYKVLAAVGATAGYGLALLLSGVVTRHISAAFGAEGITASAASTSLGIGGLVYLLINIYCKRVIRRIRKVTVVDALVLGKGFEKEKTGMKDGMYKSKLLPINWLLSLREIFYRFYHWFIVFIVMLIAVLMILIPANLVNTLEAPEFVTYMGSSREDIMIEVENGKTLEAGYAKVKQVLSQEEADLNYQEYRRVCVQTNVAEVEPMNLYIDCGEHAGNKLQYLSGKAPGKEQELAISYLNANEIGKEAGDTLILYFDGKEKEFVISGIYQDVTSGGYTAKSHYPFVELPAVKYSFTVNLKDTSEVGIIAEEWSEMLGAGVTVDPMEDFLNQTLGGVVKQLKRIVMMITVLGAGLSMLITVLFLKLRLAKDLTEIGILKAIGFSEKDLTKQYLIKMGCTSITGIIAGIALTDVLGEKIVNAALSMAGLGITKTKLIADPLIQYVLCPLLLLALILFGTLIVVKTMKRYNLISIIND